MDQENKKDVTEFDVSEILKSVGVEPTPAPAPTTVAAEPTPAPAPATVVAEPTPAPAPATVVAQPTPAPAPVAEPAPAVATASATKSVSGGKKAWGVISNIFVWLLVALAVVVMLFTIFSSTTLDHRDRSFFGYKTFIVLSDSMKATDFAAGDIIFTKQVEADTLKEGDIITFISENVVNAGEIVTHKIRKVTKDDAGNPAFVTYGTTTGVDDETPVTEAYLLGQYQFSVPKLGHFFQFLKSTPGYIICVLIPFLLLILFQAIKCFSTFRQYKREQMAEIKAEKDKIEQERLRSEAMFLELQALRAQMGNQSGSDEQPPTA